MKNQKPEQKKRKNKVRDQIEVMDLGAETEQAPAGKQSRTTRKYGRNRQFLIITYLFLIMFILTIAYMIWFQMFKSESVINSSYNTRLEVYAEHVIRGDILSSDGAVLATTSVSEDGTETRVYPYDDLFAHVVGYSSNGMSGIELDYNFNLVRSHSFFLKQIINDLTDEKNMGDTVVTTLDLDVQQAAYDALGSNDGAIVVLEVSTGKVLAMVSKPDFDANSIDDIWDSVTSDESSTVLLNRATNGLYPPGSVFKIFTLLEYLHENSDYSSYSYDCSGVLYSGSDSIHCYHGTSHGLQDIVESFANSCNTSFANLGLTLSENSLEDLCEKMLFNTSLPGEFDTASSSFSLSDEDSDFTVMQTVIGQGDTLVTPLHMAMVAAAIANDGVAMEPYVVDHTENDTGSVVKKYSSTEYGSIMSSSDAETLQTFLKAVVDSGTASALSGASYSASGKTGSAEYTSSGDSHGWFVGYAEMEGYETIAIAVIVEDGGSGSSSAVPAAKKVFDAYFSQ